MTDLFPFFIIIFAGVFFSIAFKRIHIPWVVALILAGIAIGPDGFDVLSITPTVEFLGQIGLIFLMFMAGLETKLSSFDNFRIKLGWLSFINGAVPFVIGYGIAQYFGYGYISSLLVGIIFISSSVAVIIPSLEKYGLMRTRLGQSVIMTTVLQDIASLLLLSVVLQNVDPVTSLPLVIFYPLTLLTLFVFRLLLPRASSFFTKRSRSEDTFFQQEFRSILIIILGTVIVFEFLGLHPIIAGFFAGLVLSDSIQSDKLKEKIRTVSYSIFIPTFFVIAGAQANIVDAVSAQGALWMIVAIVLGSIISKIASGFFGARLVGFTKDQSLLFGISSMPQLSTTLAVALSALSFGFVDETLISAMIVLSIVTVTASPVLMNIFGERISNVDKSI